MRILYSTLGAFAKPPLGFDISGDRIFLVPNDALQTFNPTTGNFAIFIVMNLVMQYIVVLVYVAAGTLILLEMDEVSMMVSCTLQWGSWLIRAFSL